MGFFTECIIGILAAVGLICILKVVCDIIFSDYLRTGLEAELFLYADGTDPRTENMLQATRQIRSLYFRDLRVVLIDTGERMTPYSYADALCEKYETEYIK